MLSLLTVGIYYGLNEFDALTHSNVAVMYIVLPGSVYDRRLIVT